MRHSEVTLADQVLAIAKSGCTVEKGINAINKLKESLIALGDKNVTNELSWFKKEMNASSFHSLCLVLSYSVLDAEKRLESQVRTTVEPVFKSTESQKDEVSESVRNIGYLLYSPIYKVSSAQLAEVQLDLIFEETLLLKEKVRPELEAAKKACCKGDTLHIDSFDRVCRTGVEEAVTLINEMNEKGVNVMFHKEQLGFSSPLTLEQSNRLNLLCCVEKMERNLVRERQLEGIAVARESGKRLGRPKGSRISRAKLQAAIQRGETQGLTKTEIAKQLGIGRATLYRILK